MNDPHIGFVVAAYAIAGVTVLAMIGAVLADYRSLNAHLSEAAKALEAARGGREGPAR